MPIVVNSIPAKPTGLGVHLRQIVAAFVLAGLAIRLSTGAGVFAAEPATTRAPNAIADCEFLINDAPNDFDSIAVTTTFKKSKTSQEV